MPALMSFLCGFISLSAEILWVRLFSVANGSLPKAFALVLALYLLGIALGAQLGRHACALPARAQWQRVAYAMVATFFLLLFGSQLFVVVAGSAGAFLLIAATAAAAAYAFPIMHHLGTAQGGQGRGRAFSKVYVANIAGSTLGPLGTGYFLLDMLSLDQAYAVLSLLALLSAIVIFASFKRLLPALAGVWIFLLLLPILVHPPLAPLFARLPSYVLPVKQVVENRYGVITVFSAPKGGDYVFGGNVYDGRTNLDPGVNSNLLHRPATLLALHPEPRRVLMIGLSIGSWLKLAVSFPGIETIDVIEVNPGYLTAMAAYPAQYSALQDKRVNLVLDDGRRWLRQHPERRYDVIIMNTTVHWRAYATTLLSVEFARLGHNHLAPGGIIAYNGTSAAEPLVTAREVYQQVAGYGGFVYAADFDFRARFLTPEFIAALDGIVMDGKPWLAGEARDKFLETIRTTPWIESDNLVSNGVITDANMLTEYQPTLLKKGP